MNIEIICNKKGYGKTTYTLKKYLPCRYFDSQTCKEYDSTDADANATNGMYFVIDSADSINNKLFCELLNESISRGYEKIIIIFDLLKKELLECENFNSMWECGYIEKNYAFENFIPDQKVLYMFLRDNYPQLNPTFYKDILEITNCNFSEIDRLMLWQNVYSSSEQMSDNRYIDSKALAKYITECIHKNFQDIPDANLLLEKSSLIGEKFLCDALESPDGFACEAASAYLEQMAQLHGFVRKCIDVDEQYEFVTYDVYKGIFDSISNENKSTWVRVLIQYYLSRYEHCYEQTQQLSILNALKGLYKLLPLDASVQKSVYFLLLYKYRQENNIYKALATAEGIIVDLKSVINQTEYEYIQSFMIETYMQNGDYQAALDILQNVCEGSSYTGSRIFMQYYYALCLYQTGNLDLSRKIIENLVEFLKPVSGSYTYPQEIFSIVYSLYATIQNHVGLEDGGMRYYSLAIKHAKNVHNNSSLYYDVLKKCDMFYDYPQTKESFQQCLSFYEATQDLVSAGEVYINFATEMLFQDCENKDCIKEYFERGVRYLSDCHNERTAYARNNFGIYYILAENDIENGLHYFQEALLAGLSAFSYMTIYLNICMCYILMNHMDSDEFTQAKIRFDFAIRKLSKRDNKTIYEDPYKSLLNIIITEHEGQDVLEQCRAAQRQFKENDFIVTVLSDIIGRLNNENNSSYKRNAFFYQNINRLHIFLAEFRFWE